MILEIDNHFPVDIYIFPPSLFLLQGKINLVNLCSSAYLNVKIKLKREK